MTHPAIHAILRVCNCPEIFNAVIQYIAVDVVDKVHWVVAVVRPDKPVHCIQLALVFDSSVAIAVHCTSGAPKLATPPALLPEKFSIPVFKQDIGFLARQVVVARVGLIRHR